MFSIELKSSILFLIIGLLTLNILAYLTRKSKFLPDIIWVLVLGLVYSLFSHFYPSSFPEIFIDPDLVFLIFVPLLVFASSQKICLSQLKKVFPQVTLLATVGVAISALIIAIPFYYIFSIGFAESLLFGIVISATDPLAVSSILDDQGRRVSESQKLLIEGESIINDGFVVTVYGILFLLIFSGHEFDYNRTLSEFVKHISGAVALGSLMGWCARKALSKWHEEHFTLTVNMTVVVAYGSFFFAESLGFSGILSVFSAALAFGYKYRSEDRGPNYSAHNSIWKYLEYLANSALFFTLGASFFLYFSPGQVSLLIFAVCLVLLVFSRIVSLLTLYPLIVVNNKNLEEKEFWVLNFSGARGAVSIALLLMLPDQFVFKGLFLSLAMAATFFSLLVYPAIVRRLL